jgi:phosphoglycerate dehydrogenase-like enzyme
VEARVNILGPDINGATWKERASNLAAAKHILATWGMPKMDKEFLEAAPALEAVFYGAGSVKGFATEESYERGISISSAWAANAIPVAEFTVGSILLGLKRVWEHARLYRERREKSARLEVAGGYLSRVGLVSLGAIGKLVARKLSAFELNLCAFDPYVDAETAQELGVSTVPLPDLFAACDVVSIHTPWLPETEGLITGELVASMKTGATLINTSRGAVIDEPGLFTVLAARTDLTAILDVTHPEPPKPDSPLFTLPNVILTPHIAGSMGPEIARMGRWMVDELSRKLSGQPLKHSVSREMLARMA